MDSHEKLFISQIFRIILTIIVLIFFKIPLYAKILIIMIIDNLDCPLIFNIEWVSCKKELYQKTDKITDTICFFILLLYILKIRPFSTNYIILICILFIYRIIGVILFLLKNNRKFLFYFPNMFEAITFVLALFKHFSFLKKYMLKYLITLVVILKITLEYFHHYSPIFKSDGF